LELASAARVVVWQTEAYGDVWIGVLEGDLGVEAEVGREEGEEEEGEEGEGMDEGGG
jgi:hypothetical protein